MLWCSNRGGVAVVVIVVGGSIGVWHCRHDSIVSIATPIQATTCASEHLIHVHFQPILIGKTEYKLQMENYCCAVFHAN